MRRPSITWDSPALHQVGRIETSRRPTGEAHRALCDLPSMRGEETRDRPQQRRLAGTVRAEEGDDLAFLHVEAHASQDEDDVVVDDLETGDPKEGVV